MASLHGNTVSILCFAEAEREQIFRVPTLQSRNLESPAWISQTLSIVVFVLAALLDGLLHRRTMLRKSMSLCAES